VQTWGKNRVSDDPAFQKEFQRITDGLRKAGLAEGEKTN
jgi:hypothetical protein